MVQADNMKYLGLFVDKHLSFDSHIEYILKKVNQCNRILWKMRAFITEGLAEYLYKTLIQSISGYCDFIYDGSSHAYKAKLQMAQNASLRAIKRRKQEYPMHKLHKELEIDYF